MHSQLNCIIKETSTLRTDEFHVDEERQLISTTPSGLKSVINTAFQLAADKVIDPVLRAEILALQV